MRNETDSAGCPVEKSLTGMETSPNEILADPIECGGAIGNRY